MKYSPACVPSFQMDPCEEFKVLCAENKVFPPDYICRQLASLAR